MRAAAASAETIDTGVEMTSAHGHEITSSTSERENQVPHDASNSSGGTSGNDDGQRQDDGRVDAGEAIDEGLARRALRLRALDEMDDARQRRIARAGA